MNNSATDIWIDGWKTVGKVGWVILLLISTLPTFGYSGHVIAIMMKDVRFRPLNLYKRAYDEWLDWLGKWALIILGIPTLGYTWAILNRRDC